MATDGTYQCAFLTTSDGVVLLDAPPTIGRNIQRAVDDIASANGVSNKITYLVYSHHHADHIGASSLFDRRKHYIGGHLGRLGTRDEVTLHQQYMADIAESSRRVIDTFDPTPYFVKYGANVWAAFKAGLDEMAQTAAAPVIDKYTGVFMAADVFTESTTFQVMQSIRLDLGYGWQVHPRTRIAIPLADCHTQVLHQRLSVAASLVSRAACKRCTQTRGCD